MINLMIYIKHIRIIIKAIQGTLIHALLHHKERKLKQYIILCIV